MMWRSCDINHARQKKVPAVGTDNTCVMSAASNSPREEGVWPCLFETYEPTEGKTIFISELNNNRLLQFYELRFRRATVTFTMNDIFTNFKTDFVRSTVHNPLKGTVSSWVICAAYMSPSKTGETKILGRINHIRSFHCNFSIWHGK
jgi:hypothetical protein